MKEKEKENKRNGWWVDGPPSRWIDTEVDWQEEQITNKCVSEWRHG